MLGVQTTGAALGGEMKDAFLVLVTNARTGEIASAGIYSEPSPTLPTTQRAVVLLHRQADEYETARDEIRAVLRQALKHGDTRAPRLVRR